MNKSCNQIFVNMMYSQLSTIILYLYLSCNLIKMTNNLFTGGSQSLQKCTDFLCTFLCVFEKAQKSGQTQKFCAGWTLCCRRYSVPDSVLQSTTYACRIFRPFLLLSLSLKRHFHSPLQLVRGGDIVPALQTRC